MSRLARLLPNRDNAERRLVLSEVLGQPVAVRMMQYRIRQLKRQQALTDAQTSSNKVASHQSADTNHLTSRTMTSPTQNPTEYTPTPTDESHG